MTLSLLIVGCSSVSSPSCTQLTPDSSISVASSNKKFPPHHCLFLPRVKFVSSAPHSLCHSVCVSPPPSPKFHLFDSTLLMRKIYHHTKNRHDFRKLITFCAHAHSSRNYCCAHARLLRNFEPGDLMNLGESENQAVSNFESRFRVKPRDMSVSLRECCFWRSIRKGITTWNTFSQALGPNSRVVAYLPGLRTILHRLRATSATPSSLYTSPQLHSLTPSLASNTGSLLASNKQTEIAGVSFNPLLPLPGVMAPVAPPTQEATPTENETSPPVLSSSKQGLQYMELKTTNVTTKFLLGFKKFSFKNNFSDTIFLFLVCIVSETDQGVVECLVQQCPPSLHSDFMDLFPGVTIKKGYNYDREREQ